MNDFGRGLDCVVAAVSAEILSDHNNFFDAFAVELFNNHRDGQNAINWLPAGHCDDIVIKNFIGDVNARGDGGAYGE